MALDSLRKQRGFALVTGLFSLSLLYLLATIVAGTARQNFDFTRQSLQVTQAQMLALAGSNYALDRLNQPAGPAWETSHKNAPETISCNPQPPVDGAFRVWTQDVPGDSFRIYIISEGLVAQKVYRKKTLVRKAPAVQGVKYAVLNGTTQKFGSVAPPQPYRLFKRDNTGLWLPMIEPWRFEDPPGTFPFAWATTFGQPSGDNQGNVYLVTKHPTTGSSILFYSASTNLWTQLKTVPTEPAIDPVISDLTTLPNGGAFCYAEYPGGTWPLRLWYLSSADATLDWQEIPSLQTAIGVAPLPTRLGAPSNGGIWQLSQIAADDDSLYALQRDSNRIFRYRPSTLSPINWLTGTWKELPPPRQVNFTVSGNKLQGPSPAPGNPKVDWLAFLAVDTASGQVFARGDTPNAIPPAPQPIDTIYRYAPHPNPNINGNWTADPLPAPGYKYNRTMGWKFNGTYEALALYLVDYSAKLSAVWSLANDNDIHYVCDLTQKRWVYQGPVSYFDGGTAGNVIEYTANGPDVTSLGGGGVADPSRVNVYTPIYGD